MRPAAAALALLFVAGCPSPDRRDGGATPPASPSATPGDHVLGVIHAECTGLAKSGDCKNAATACSKALELFAAAKVPETDKHLVQVRAAVEACAAK